MCACMRLHGACVCAHVSVFVHVCVHESTHVTLDGCVCTGVEGKQPQKAHLRV